LLATPDPNYQVRAWYGTDNDASKEPNNTVTVRGSNVFVAVEFGSVGQGIINLYTASGALDRRSPFPTFQAAIDAAGANYSVVASDGIYTGPGNYNINLRAGLGPNDVRPITVRSENGPEKCIIDCQGFGRAFIFDSNEDPNYIVEGLTITNGFAAFGGAMLIDNSSPRITNCRIISNRATGNGGAIYCTNASPEIINTQISNNTAGGFGGGIYCQSVSAPEIINCLITFNSSGDIGGAMYLYNSPAIITLCTIAYNDGLDYGDGGLYPNPKGGIACRDSTPVISNCIIGRSGGMWGVWGDQFSAGDDLYNCTATYSCIENGDDGDGNIDGNPLWVAGALGDFYLSQVNSGQAQTSPCVNAGEQYVLSTLQATYNLGAITTSIMNYPDVGYADMGYHYPFFTGPPIQYTLVIFVVGHGTVEPNQWPEVNYYDPGTLVSLKAIPDPNYRVRRWTGTDNDTSASVLNSVTMYSNRTVRVEFEPAIKRILNVSTDGRYTYTGLQQAIDDAREGDIVVLHSGRYAGTGFTVMGKNITITGTNPDDPNVVASTVIDCTGEIQGGIYLIGAPGGRCVLNGITIMNSHPGTIDSPGPQGDGARGIDGGDSLPYAYMETAEGAFTGTGYIYSDSALTVIGNHIVSNCIIRNCSVTGGDASGGNQGANRQKGGNGGNGGHAGGAGIYIGDIFEYYYDYPDVYDFNDPNWWIDYEPILLRWGSSPIIRNCVIDNCVATAGNGGNGATGGTRASGGNGGVPGRALGAGIYCDVATSPTIINCTVTNCQAVSGNGGNGGDGGAEAGAGGFGGLTYADPCQLDPELFSAYGAGVYCGMMSNPTFIDCTFSNNVTDGSVSGVGGRSVPSNVQQQPRRNYDIPSYGAGVYCDTGSSSTFENCNVQGNRTTYHTGVYSGYGGGVCFDGSKTDYEEYYYYDYSFYNYYYLYYLSDLSDGNDSNALGVVSAILVDCNLANNSASVGGGLYGVAATLTVVDSNFAANSSYVGGGLCSTDSTVVISGSTVQRNIASPAADPTLPPNDPNSIFRFGAGGGIYCFATDISIRDCDIAYNIATGSGGGVYLFGDSNSPQITNCLITNNLAGRDGGGVSVNWYAEPNIANCTFVGNAATGGFGSSTGVGGGFYCSYGSISEVNDCIFWNNYALKGPELGVGTGFEYDPRPSKLTVSFSDVKGSRPGIQVDTGCTLKWGPGNIEANPLFVTGMFGDYYLSQIGTGDPNQTQNSPCVDKGSNFASNLGMVRYTDPTGTIVGYTTRTDGELERGKVDMGFHYRTVEPCRFCDLIYDHGSKGIIDFRDFAKLALSWLDQGCSDINGWCRGADLTFDKSVDLGDLAYFAECWLVADTEAPIPDPSEWELEPYLTSSTAIRMVARKAFDAWGWDVEYFFDCIYGNCHSSNWRSSPIYNDAGLKVDSTYAYRVKARDEIGNETEWSVIRYAGVIDTKPPAPAPTWLTPPYAVDYNSIAMQATTAYDDSGVMYGFWNVTKDPAGNNVIWQPEPGTQFVDVNLDPNTTYCYRVKARDNSANQNQTAWSDIACETTPLPPDRDAPTPDPARWDPNLDPNGFDGKPRKVNIGGEWDDYCAVMRAMQATDASGFVEYKFVCKTGDPIFSSGWQTSPTYTRQLGGWNVVTDWVVIVRDRYGNETAPSEEWRAMLP
jgi:predicted outer membrane repeat protein